MEHQMICYPCFGYGPLENGAPDRTGLRPVVALRAPRCERSLSGCNRKREKGKKGSNREKGKKGSNRGFEKPRFDPTFQAETSAKVTTIRKPIVPLLNIFGSPVYGTDNYGVMMLRVHGENCNNWLLNFSSRLVNAMFLTSPL